MPEKPTFEKPSNDKLWNLFRHHVPFGNQAERYSQLRRAAFDFAKVVRDLTPCSPQQTAAINKIHLALMLANAAIAVNEVEPQPAEQAETTKPEPKQEKQNEAAPAGD